MDTCAWSEQQGEDRQDWDNYDGLASSKWEEFMGKLLVRLEKGEFVDFYPSTMTKMSGSWGAVLHFAWHFPSYKAASTSFAHVLDPSNSSLARQVKRIGTPLTVSTSDMIPILANAKKPD
ncbi:hypothetical protein ACHAPE_002773 [Trichoderma viride]